MRKPRLRKEKGGYFSSSRVLVSNLTYCVVTLEYLQKAENQKESIGGALSEEGIVEDRSYKNIGWRLFGMDMCKCGGGGTEDEGGGKRSLTKLKHV